MTSNSKTTYTWTLALETSSLAGSLALGRGPTVFETRQLESHRRHAAELLPCIDTACKARHVSPSDVGIVHVSCGPGSFTGLRIAITVARMLAFANDTSIVSVPSLDVIAQNAIESTPQPQRVVVIRDAKRNRAYAASFVRVGDLYEPTSEPAERDPAVFLADQEKPCAVLGDGIEQHRVAIEKAGVEILPTSLGTPRAETVYRLGTIRAAKGLFATPRELIPTYVRRPEPEEKWEARQGE